MRILLDENLDWRLGRGLLGHEVELVQRLGWAGIQNGVLLKKADETGFEVLITMDSNMTLLAFERELLKKQFNRQILCGGASRRFWEGVLFAYSGRNDSRSYDVI